MPDQPGYLIGGHFYPVPTSFKVGDPILVQDVTGLSWEAFVDLLPSEDDPDETSLDPVVQAGLIAIAVWHGNPGWRRDKVVRYTLGLDMDAIEPVGPDVDDEAEEGETRPPARKKGQAGATK